MQTLEEKQQDGMTGAGPETEFHTELCGFNRVEDVYKRQIYLIEAFSVMLQVTYFKLTHGKRIFKMSPIHHHFEMCGWSEVKIVSVFSFITLVGVCLLYTSDNSFYARVRPFARLARAP